VKEPPEDLLLMTIVGRMLLPEQRIASYSVEVSVILRAERPEFEKIAFQDWLRIEGHPSELH
jgi:hypothetical protein